MVGGVLLGMSSPLAEESSSSIAVRVGGTGSSLSSKLRNLDGYVASVILQANFRGLPHTQGSRLAQMLHTTLLLLTWSSQLRPAFLSHRLRARGRDIGLTMPPALNNADGFGRGELGDGAWWRQDTTRVQIVVELPEDASFKRDVEVDVSRRSIALRVLGADILVGSLAHEVDASSAEWVVDDEMGGDFDGERFLVVDLPKRESYVDWSAPLAGDGGQRRLRIGGKGEAQKDATAQQLASYQVLQKLPSAERGDIYARVPSDASGVPSTTLFFVGKVIAEATPAALSLASQELLVKEHARLYLPKIFGEVGDEAMELWLAPGNSEMRVAQNEIGLRRWHPPDAEAGAPLPSAGACGFEPETAPPAHLEAPPLSVQRDTEGRPLGEAFKANVMSPDEVPGAYGAWLKDQL